ncbi:Heavy-metal-associated domain protein [Pseudobythopirellula maris]|uniref:Heavy-metal-associated domain protein n=1 Tax=Pseudobythopirellula maris TaxID=2527991 RepID=A0A5C5ZI91_9BACT|nr:cation transporter [Pseudobythopirellula maris]TWT86717.1 Heavy-metal-associated domain protein [Pseudobythopirellula maris]
MHMNRHRLNCLIASIAVSALATNAAALAAPSGTAVRQVQIVDEAMCCAGCARKVSGQLYATRGVREVGVDMESRTLTVSLPEPTPAMLGRLWHAVERGNGTPTKLITSEATYTLVRPELDPAKQQAPAAEPLAIAINNLHCQDCANKIARQLYALKGVTKVSVDMQRGMLFLETSRGTRLSPWALIDATAKANERPLAVFGGHGKLTIEWATEAPSKDHQQAQQLRTGGYQR